MPRATKSQPFPAYSTASTCRGPSSRPTPTTCWPSSATAAAASGTAARSWAGPVSVHGWRILKNGPVCAA